MDPRRQKRIRRIAQSSTLPPQSSLLHAGSVSRRGLVDIIKQIKDLNPDKCNAEQLLRQEHAAFEAVPVSETVIMDDGSEWI